jgi:ribosome-associated protein
MDLTKVSDTLDFFVITTGNTKMHNKAMADEVMVALKKMGIHNMHTEGYPEGEWILIDYGSVIVHIFADKLRSFYQLERLWGDAEFFNFPNSRESS